MTRCRALISKDDYDVEFIIIKSLLFLIMENKMLQIGSNWLDESVEILEKRN
jgi:hypothetical protein